MDFTTNVKGQLAVSKAEMRAFELGYLPSRPLYDARYDLVVDDGTKLHRLQIKYADGKSSHSSGSVVVKLDYESRTKLLHTYKDGEVDALVVYISQIDKLCFIPKEIFLGKRKLTIRIKNAKNNQKNRIIAAEAYYW